MPKKEKANAAPRRAAARPALESPAELYEELNRIEAEKRPHVEAIRKLNELRAQVRVQLGTTDAE
jgi:hypothetical protein